MKHPYITLFIALTFIINTNNAQAQILNNIGLKGGISISNQKYYFKSMIENLDKRLPILSLSYAINGEIFNSKHFNMITDIGYTSKGCVLKIPYTQIDMPEGNGTYSYLDSRFTFLFFNAMVKYKYPVRSITPYILGG